MYVSAMFAPSTVFQGVSLWAEVPGLQPCVQTIAEKYQLFPHPAHMTLVYALMPETDDEDPELNDKWDRLQGRLHEWKGGIVLKPSRLEAGVSKLFGHGYCDMFFHQSNNDTLAELFQVAMATLEWDEGSDSFAGAPHTCLGYASDALEAFTSGEIASQIPALCPELWETELRIESVALWKTAGRLQDWKCLKRYSLTD